jgi:hypothetical protein
MTQIPAPRVPLINADTGLISREWFRFFNYVYEQLGAGTGYAQSSADVSYDEGGTGAVLRSVQSKLRESVSVKDFGAVGDGVTDDTAAIQSCLSALPNGGDIYIPAGRYKITGTLTSNADGLSIVGAGPGATVLNKAFTTNNLFNLSGAKLRISNMLIDSSLTHTSGILFNFTTPSGNIWVDNIFTNKCFNIINFLYATQTFVSNCLFNNFINDGIRYNAGVGGIGIISNVRMGLDAATNVGTGLYIEGGDTFHISNVDVTSAYYPIRFFPPSGALLVNIFCVNVTADGVNRTNGGSGWTINGTSSSAILRRIKLVNCWGGINFLNGFDLSGVDDVQLSNCIAISNQRNGIYITGSPNASNVKISNCTITGNSLNNSGVYSGIYVENYTDNFLISNNSCKQNQGTSNTQEYGIKIVGTNHTNYIISNNDLTVNLTGGLLDQGGATVKQIANNLGFKTLAQGSSSFAAQTSKVISHGLSVTPQLSAITVSMNSDPGATIRLWVSAATATTFTVNTDISATFAFSWTASVEG